MNMQLIVALLYLIAIIASLIALFLWISPHKNWHYDKNNPYRRYCVDCGQEQHQYTLWNGAVKWENVGRDYPCKKSHWS